MATTIRAELENIGFVWRATPDDTDPLPNEVCPTLALRLPIGQRVALESADGVDPSHVFDDTTIPVPAGSRIRRLLSRLVRADLLAGWHAFIGTDGNLYVHIRFGDLQQARRFYRNIDWAASNIVISGRRPEHTFLGD